MRRIGLIVLAVALVLGGVAVWGLVGLLKGRGGGVDTVPVVVAGRAIEFGQTLTPDMLHLQAWPANAVPEGAFGAVADLTAAEARVALRPMEANEPILASRISGAGGRATLSAAISEGHRAVAIRVNDVIGVAGFVLPGDLVDILLTRQEGAGYNNQSMRTDLLVENVRVLAVDQSASESSNDPQVARAVTIEVTPADGQKIALASQIGTLSLSLRRPDDVGVTGEGAVPTRTIRIEDLRAASGERAPVVTAVRAPRPQRAGPAGPTIEIIRGFSSNRASVPSE